MIMYGHRQSTFKQDVLRTRGWHSLQGLGQIPMLFPYPLLGRRRFRGFGQVLCPGGVPCAGGLPNFNEEQWYELIALTSNQPLASVQATYSQIAPGQDYGGQPYFAQKAPLTNLQIALGQWPGGIAHSAYLAYQQGNIVDAVQGGHYFQYGGAWVGTMGQLAQNNPWAIPAQQPTTQQVQAATTAMFSQYQQAMAAPVYSQPQNPAAVIAAYNAANPQALVIASPTPAGTTPLAGAPPSTSVQASSQQSVSPAPPGGAVTISNGSQGTGTTTTTTGVLGADWIPGIPNVALLIAGGAAVVLMMAGRR